jgi:predicted enzyme related to lactoylglutathione lyase
MGERTKYTPGTFCWADLASKDQAASKAFYTELFGWDVEDMPVGDGVFYSMMSVGGKPVAAVGPQPQAQRDAGVPPAWQSYISVEDADATLERAKELGGTVHAPAFDVMTAGRMGVVQDPGGAYFLVWQPRDHIGAQRVNGHGLLTWNELATKDIAGASKFYGDLFGWQFEPLEGMPMPYSIVKNSAGWNNGGIRGPGDPNEPPHWLVYFGADDINASIAKAGELGGSTMGGPIEIGVGRIAVLRDPQGAVFALFSGELQD